jgi:SAM-dependent methyltransferase
VNEYPSNYGETFAAVYDEIFASPDETAVVTEFLASLAGDGRALELGVGTGRFALPLVARGVAVVGIDASAAMLARLRALPGGATLPVLLGDFADPPLAGPFELIYVVYNTFFLLPSRAAQARCLTSAAALLEPSGAFVVEAYVPSAQRFAGENATRLESLPNGGYLVTAARDEPAAQRLELTFTIVRDGATTVLRQRLCYAGPDQLDALAEQAGLRLAERWAGWRGEPFSAASARQVALYRRAAAPTAEAR